MYVVFVYVVLMVGVGDGKWVVWFVVFVFGYECWNYYFGWLVGGGVVLYGDYVVVFVEGYV